MKTLEYNGKTQTLADWALDLGVHYDTMRARVKKHGNHPRVFRSGRCAARQEKPMRMREAINFIKQFETFTPRPRMNLSRHWQIGFGHHILAAPGPAGQTTALLRFPEPITEQQAESILHNDLTAAEQTLLDLVTARLTMRQQIALMSLVTDIGSSIFAQTSIAARINAGDYARVAAAFLNFSYVLLPDGERIVCPDLLRRREAEKSLFEGGV